MKTEYKLLCVRCTENMVGDTLIGNGITEEMLSWPVFGRDNHRVPSQSEKILKDIFAALYALPKAFYTILFSCIEIDSENKQLIFSGSLRIIIRLSVANNELSDCLDIMPDVNNRLVDSSVQFWTLFFGEQLKKESMNLFTLAKTAIDKASLQLTLVQGVSMAFTSIE